MFATAGGGAGSNSHYLELDISSIQYATITDAAQTGLEISGDKLTIESWINFQSQTATHALITKWNGTGPFCYRVEYGWERIAFRVSADGSELQDHVEWTFTPTNTEWHHYAWVWDGSLTVGTGSLKFFYDGVEFTTGFNALMTNNITSISDQNVGFTIGANADAFQPTDAFFDDVRIWNVARTEAQINDNKSTQLVGNESGLVGYWKLNNDLLDATSNNNDLTGVNSPTFAAPSGAPF